MLPDLPSRLEERLLQPLPGSRVQRVWQPQLSFGRHFGPAPAHARPAAVLILLYPRDGQWHVPLTLRHEKLPDHAGQISFPGGMIEAGERSSDAALRELEEELGVGAAGLRLLGELSSVYLFKSNFQITPWVAATDVLPTWRLSPNEVAALLEAPLTSLADPAQRAMATQEWHGVRYSAPGVQFAGHHIWGATSLILGELLAVLEELDAAGAEHAAAPHRAPNRSHAKAEGARG